MLISPHRDRPDSPHYIKTLSPAQHQEPDKPSQQEKPPHTPPRQLLPVKHACSGRGCIRDQSFPGNDSLKQHLLLGRVRHWCLPELGHTALPGSGFTGQSWNYPCGTKMELKVMAQLRLQQSHNAVTRDSRTLLLQAVPEHTLGDGTTLQLLHFLSPALSDYPQTKITAWEMLLFTSWDTHKLHKTKSGISQWPKGSLSRNNSTFIVKCYGMRKVFLKIICSPSSFSGCIFFISTVERIQQ